ncbi:MAG: ribonuclease HII [Saprospiraceae bacterium]
MTALLSNFSGHELEAGCDEAGRGCLAGPVFAAAVILPQDFYHPDLNDSKKLNEDKREKLRPIIEKESIAWCVAKLDPLQIDKYNILWASVKAMHKALKGLIIAPNHIIVDGNKFLSFRQVPHDCIIGGDAIYMSIAAASILAKTHRDVYMRDLHRLHPQYHWDTNKGYPTEEHRQAILDHGPTKHHRKSFKLLPDVSQLSLF